MNRFALALAALLCAAHAASAQGPVTSAFTYQGEIRQSGTPVAAPVDLRFRLYDAPTAGTQVGPQLGATAITPSEGRFTIDLDFGAVFSGQARYLEIDVRTTGTPSYTTLSPRQPLTATPNAAYALAAASASQLNGQSASYYTNAANLSSGTIPDARLSGAYSGPLILTNAANSFTGRGDGLTFLNASSLAIGTLPDSRLSPNVPLLTASNTFSGETNTFSGAVTMSGFALPGPAAHPGYVLTAGEAGVGTWQPSQPLVLPFEGFATIPFPGCVFSITSTGFSPAICGTNTSPTGPTFGIQGHSASNNGTGIQGTGATGVHGFSTQSNGKGVTGYASGGPDAWAVAGETITGQAIIGRAGNNAPFSGFPQGTGVVGYTDVSTGFVNGIGVYGEAAAPTGLTAGAYFRNASNSGTAVRAWATATNGQTFGGDFATSGNNFAAAVRGGAVASSGNTFGGDFSAESTDGIAVRGKANALTGFTWGGWFESRSSTFGTGVVGRATSPTGVTYGVFGTNGSSDPNAYAIFAQGRLGASGTKTFRIDHPLDPDHKYLMHYSTESPEVLNAYSGKVTLDNTGAAIITLPDYFAAINTDPRYTLTPIGAPMPMLHIAREIDDRDLAAGATAAPGTPVPHCSFRIAGGAPGAKVSWRIEAIRNDRWVRDHGAPIETNKPATEPGAPQYPDLSN